jgi:hypothetical protein
MILRMLKLTARILPVVGGLLLVATPFLPWAYSGITHEPSGSIWSMLSKDPGNIAVWAVFVSGTILGTFILVLHICTTFMKGILAYLFWCFNLIVAFISFFTYSLWMTLVIGWGPYLAAPNIGVYAGLVGSIIAVIGLLFHKILSSLAANWEQN